MQEQLGLLKLRIEVRSVLTNAHRGRNPPDSFFTDLMNPLAVGQCFGNSLRQDAAHFMGRRGIFHSSCYVNRVTVDANGALCVTLFAYDNIATMDSDPKSRDDAKQPLVCASLPFDRVRVNALENGISFYRCGPTPHRNQTVAFV